MLWHFWLGIRKSIRPVKIEWWDVGVVIYLERGAYHLHVVHLMPLHPKTLSSLASFKSILVSPFWYWLTQVVLEKKLFMAVVAVVLIWTVVVSVCFCGMAAGRRHRIESSWSVSSSIWHKETRSGGGKEVSAWQYLIVQQSATGLWCSNINCQQTVLVVNTDLFVI